MDASKALSDFLRKNYQLGASHAREVAAAILGFKSHAAYLNAVRTESWQLPDLQTFAPDVSLVRARLRSLSGLPELPDAELLTTAAIQQLRMLRFETGLHIHEVCFLGRQDEPETIHTKKHPKAGQLFRINFGENLQANYDLMFHGQNLTLEDWAHRISSDRIGGASVSALLSFYAHRSLPDLNTDEDLTLDSFDLSGLVFGTVMLGIGGVKKPFPIILRESELEPLQ
ncbi:hypothetical protein KF913_07765 [Candidatus Obscuribacterales bacterium]|nr:hypothetical protein [Candidatus Obscuribacterales bacterium]